MFGPETEKFQEAMYFHQHGLAFEIKSADELSTKVLYLKDNPDELAQISALCRKQTASMKGAVNKVFEEIYGGM
jgi:3-deoxy-D-manno-octulosonic-acid transferase